MTTIADEALDTLGFDGEPTDADVWAFVPIGAGQDGPGPTAAPVTGTAPAPSAAPGTPAPRATSAVPTTGAVPVRGTGPATSAGPMAGDPAAAALRRLRGGIVAAHSAAMRVQAALAEQAIAALRPAPAAGTRVAGPSAPPTTVPTRMPTSLRVTTPTGAPAVAASPVPAAAAGAGRPEAGGAAIHEPEIHLDLTIPAEDPAAGDGWLSLPAVLRLGWAALLRHSPHLADRPTSPAHGHGWWEPGVAAIVTAGPLPRPGERLRVRGVTRVDPLVPGEVAAMFRVDAERGPLLEVTDCRARWFAPGDDHRWSGGHTLPALAAGTRAAGTPDAPAPAGERGAVRGSIRVPEWTPDWPEAAFKPLARTGRTALDLADLRRLARGDIPGVFGPAYDQEGVNPAVRLAGAGPLAAVPEIAPRGGDLGRGGLRAVLRPGIGPAQAPVKPAPAAVAALAAAWDAAAVFALYLGLHLVLADAHLDVALPDERLELAAGLGRLTVEVHAPGALAAGEVELSLTVTDVDLVPRPWLRADVHLRNGDGPVATVRGLALAVRERPGAPIGPDEDGTIPGFLGRRGPDGRRALLGELHMAHGARGDLAVALGPQFAASMGRRACRLPSGGLRLVDRFMAVTGRRGELGGGATAVTEYDSPADAWYYTDSPSPTMPNVVHMETSLQSALMLGYYLGATLTDPDEQYCLRNLDGTATVLREVDLAGRTIRQTSTLLSTTVLTGAVLQNFRYELSLVPKDPEDPTSSAEATGTDGSAGSEPFYVGESLFGFFNSTTLANQNGLDGGAFVPTWLERTRPAPASVRTIDVAGRRAAGAPLCATGAMALLDSVTVVPDGGDFGRGYLHATRPVGPDDWYFARHFWLDPVMPGSLGVEAVIQALQEWMVDSGLLDGLAEPRFVMPVGLPMTWRYRGQILADDGELTLEAHIKQVRRQTGRVRVVADASVWKPGLRIYELTDIAAEARGEGAQPW